MGKCQRVLIHLQKNSFHQFININIDINIPVPSAGLKTEMSLEVFLSVKSVKMDSVIDISIIVMAHRQGA